MICLNPNYLQYNMRAFLEKIGGEWLDDFVYMSKEPLKSLGFTIVPFDGDDIEGTLTCKILDIEKDVIFGSVEATNAFFTACGINIPQYLGYPEELTKFLGRHINRTILKNITIPTFIKPAYDVKLFTGCVIDSDQSLMFLKQFSNVNDDTVVYESSLLNFVSEYRCFVHEEKLEGIQYYLGDFKQYPDVDVIEDMIASYKASNCAYTLDVGITEDGRTVLIEVNDMWAIGSYGMDARTYTLMCVRRMREIGRQAKGEETPLWKRIKSGQCKL